MTCVVQVGRALAVSILDLAGSNPWSRVRSSEYRGLPGLKDWLRRYVQTEQSSGLARPSVQRRTSIQVGSP